MNNNRFPRQDAQNLALVATPSPRTCQYIFGAPSTEELQTHLRTHGMTTEGLMCPSTSLAGGPYCEEHAAVCFIGRVQVRIKLTREMLR
jgi:hypothetical protein